MVHKQNVGCHRALRFTEGTQTPFKLHKINNSHQKQKFGTKASENRWSTIRTTEPDPEAVKGK